MMGVLSYSLNKWYKHYGIEGAKNLQSFISINMRGLPNSIEDISLENDSVGKLEIHTIFSPLIIGLRFDFPIRDNIETAIQDSHKNFKNILTWYAVASLATAASFISLLPDFLANIFVFKALSKIDLVYSNIPFSSEPWHICNRESKKIGTFSNVYFDWKLFFVATTYKDELRLT